MRDHGRLDPADERLAELVAEAAADQDGLDVDQVDGRGDGGAEGLDRAVDQLVGQRVAGVQGGLPDAAAHPGAAQPLLDGQQLGRAAGGRGRPGGALQGDPAGVGLHAAAAPARAQLAAVDHHHVADLAGRPVGAGPQPAAEDEGAAHPRPGEHAQQVVEAAAGPEPVLGQGGHDHVVVDHHPLDPEGVGDHRPQRHRVAEPGQVGRSEQVAGVRVDPPRRPDPHPGQLAHRDLGRLGRGLDHAGDLGHHRRRPALDRGLAPGLAEPGAVVADDHALDLGPAKVDPCRMHDPDDASILRKVETGIGAVADETACQVA